MEYFVFDTETSGKEDTDEVIQFAGIHLNEDLKVIGLVNWYCSIPFHINDEATNVHGITDEILAKLSNGNFLEDYLNAPENKWLTSREDITFIAYNSRFDKKMINNTLKRNGYARFNFGRTSKLVPNKDAKGRYNVCLMEASSGVFNYIHGNKKLCDVVNSQTKYTTKELECMLGELCTHYGVRQNNLTKFHDALFDAFALTMLLHSNKMYFLAK